MPLPKLNLEPSQDGYGMEDADGAVLRAKPSAGPSRMRLDMFNAPPDVPVSFSLDRGEYAYFRAFFRTTIAEGSLPFLIDLVVDNPDPTEHEVRIIPGSVRLSALRGLRHVVQARLEVKVKPRDTAYDEGVVMLYGEYGDEADSLLLLLEKLANVDLAVLA